MTAKANSKDSSSACADAQAGQSLTFSLYMFSHEPWTANAHSDDSDQTKRMGGMICIPTISKCQKVYFTKQLSIKIKHQIVRLSKTQHVITKSRCFQDLNELIFMQYIILLYHDW